MCPVPASGKERLSLAMFMGQPFHACTSLFICLTVGGNGNVRNCFNEFKFHRAHRCSGDVINSNEYSFSCDSRIDACDGSYT